MNILHNKKLLVSVSVSTMLIGIMGGTALAQTTSYNEVHLGSRGQDVVRLQAALEGKSFLILNGAKKGYFGNLTLDALRSFQRSQGLNVSGIADQDTWEKIKTNNGMPDNMMSVDTNTKAASLRVLLNSINREHANLASIALRKGFDGAADFDASFKALDNNSVEIGKSIGAVYGAAAETTFLEIWRSHITYFVNYTLASKAHDQVKKDMAVADLAGYVNRVSDFLSNANPNLPRDAVHQIVTEHVRLLRSTIDKHFAGDYSGSYTDQHATDVQIGTALADTVAGAIVKQYPERFNR